MVWGWYGVRVLEGDSGARCIVVSALFRPPWYTVVVVARAFTPPIAPTFVVLAATRGTHWSPPWYTAYAPVAPTLEGEDLPSSGTCDQGPQRALLEGGEARRGDWWWDPRAPTSQGQVHSRWWEPMHPDPVGPDAGLW
jgi:hypothetical protein